LQDVALLHHYVVPERDRLRRGGQLLENDTGSGADYPSRG
jgi:hypothetical protein